MLIIEVALGIVLAVIILNFLPVIIWLVAIVGGITVLLLMLAVLPRGTVVPLILFVTFTAGLRVMRGK